MKKNEIEEIFGLNRTTIYKWEKGDDEGRKLLSKLLLSIPAEYVKGDLLFKDAMILRNAKKYFDDMETVFEKSLKMENGQSYYRREQAKHKDDIYGTLPIWLIKALESEDFVKIGLLGKSE